MDLSNVVVDQADDKVMVASAVKALPVDSVVSPKPIVASAYKGGYFVNTTYSTEEERGQIRFKLPKGARLVINQPWYAHALLRPRDISKATVAVFEHLGIRYTFAREFVG